MEDCVQQEDKLQREEASDRGPLKLCIILSISENSLYLLLVGARASKEQLQNPNGAQRQTSTVETESHFSENPEDNPLEINSASRTSYSRSSRAFPAQPLYGSPLRAVSEGSSSEDEGHFPKQRHREAFQRRQVQRRKQSLLRRRI